MAILVTGSSGFVGRHVVQMLADRGAKPVGFDVAPPPPGSLPEGVPFVQGSIVNIEEIMAAIVEHKIRSILALGYVQAALMAPEFRDYTGAARVNVLGVTNIFEAARLSAVERVVFFSSAGVYGPQSIYGDRPVTEDDPPAPQSLYGKMKLVNEEIGRQYALKFGLEVVLLRPTAILGSGTTMWPERLIAQPAIGQSSHIDSSASRCMNGLAVSDMADLCAKILLAPKVRHDCYLASGHAFTWSEIADFVRKHVPEAAIAFDESAPARAGGFAHLCDNSRAVQEFEWQVHSLEEAVLMVINGARQSAGLPAV